MACFFIYAVILLVLPFLCFIPIWPDIYKLRRHLIYDVDHVAIRDAAWSLQELKYEELKDEKPLFIQGDSAEIPKAIRDLAPNVVVVTQDYVQIGMAGGFYYQGLIIYRKGETGDGDVKIIDGMWYQRGE